jgi:hypothetical protein
LNKGFVGQSPLATWLAAANISDGQVVLVASICSDNMKTTSGIF